MAAESKSKVYCADVYVKESSYATESNKFDGVFASKAFKSGELIEKGIMRRFAKDFDGMNNPYVFTWSDDKPNYTWAMGSGCSTFYNTAKPENANTRMVRHFDEDRFEIFAIKDIAEDEELVHTYKSLQWRTVFLNLSEEI
jgi:hypothetical protein